MDHNPVAAPLVVLDHCLLHLGRGGAKAEAWEGGNHPFINRTMAR